MSGLLSVLMCVYDTPIDYLQDAVNSILNQTFNNFELIIVDDCSKKEMVLEYLDKIESEEARITIIHNEKNQGLTKSLNIGLKACIGDYIARMDSDDISLPERFYQQICYMQKHPEVALVGCDIIRFTDKNDNLNYDVERNVYTDQQLYKVCSLLQHSGPAHPTFMFRTKFLRDNNIQYPERILKAQDYGIMAQILKHGGEIRIIPKPLVKYRIHSRQITTKHEKEQKIYQLAVSFDYVKSLFPELDDGECISISALGCPVDTKEIVEELDQNETLRSNCNFDPAVIDMLDIPKIYVRAQKKVFEQNRKRQLFDQRTLKAELGFRWWALAIRKGLKDKKHWGLSIYTLGCVRYSILRKIKNKR